MNYAETMLWANAKEEIDADTVTKTNLDQHQKHDQSVPTVGEWDI